jgi:hypothetical protein
MSGVSITEGGGNVDIAAILEAGQDFQNRMKAFKDARDAANEARENLRLGKDARSALDEAARVLDEAKNTRDQEHAKLLQYVANTKADVTAWAQETRGAALQAREQADALLAEAQKKHDLAAQTLADAQTKADEINGRVEALKAKFRSSHAGLAAEVEAL